MTKHRKINIYSKIETKIIKHFKCCFYWLYKPIYVLFYCFLCNLLNINMLALYLCNERFLLSLSRLLAFYKPNILIQY